MIKSYKLDWFSQKKKKSEKMFPKRRCEKLCGLKILGGKILWGCEKLCGLKILGGKILWGQSTSV